jgi:quaternary ammonium compound-resistance protein SugE
LGKANETKGIESTYWMLVFLLSYKYATAVKATQELPIGTAYGLDWYWSWGTVLVGIVVFKEPATLENFL